METPSLSQGVLAKKKKVLFFFFFVLAVRRDVDNRHRHTLSVLQTLEPRGTR